MPDKALAAILASLSLLTRFAFLNYPREVVFDEYHFGKFVNGYIKGEYFFDIHPPLGKLVLALSAWMGGYKGEQGWETIGEAIPPSVNLFSLRAAPALQGSLLAPLMYCCGRALGLSQPAALLAAAGALFDICCLVEQRLVLTDATLLIGIVLQLFGTFSSDHHVPLSRGWFWSTSTAGIGIALAISTKWTGASTIVVAGIHSLLSLVHGRFSRRERLVLLFKEALMRAALLLIAPLATYVLCGWIHLALLPNTGPGAKFMTPRFRASLRPSPNMTAAFFNFSAKSDPAALPSFMDKFIELNREMYRANSSIKKEHKWGSRWWEWPLMMRSVLYWTGKERPYIAPPLLPFARIYCIGNPVVWWLAAAAPLIFAAMMFSRWLRRPAAAAPADAPAVGSAATGAASSKGNDGSGHSGEGETSQGDEGGTGASSTLPPAASEANAVRSSTGWLLLLGYVVNWLPFILISRVAFLYHFLPTLLHALLLVGVLLDLLIPATPLISDARTPTDARLAALVDPASSGAFADDVRAPDGARWLAASACIAVMAASFGFFAPLAYGTPMSTADFESRMWLESWK